MTVCYKICKLIDFLTWLDNIDLLKAGGCIEVFGGKIEVFKEYMRLVIDRWGKITESTDTIKDVNRKNNLSNVAYERIE